MRSHRKWFFLLSLALTQCTTVGDVIESKEQGGGTTKTYALSYDKAWDMTKQIFRREGGETIEENLDEGYMLTTTTARFHTWGTLMGAWLVEVQPNETRVTVVTKRRGPTNIFTVLTENGFHRELSESANLP